MRRRIGITIEQARASLDATIDNANGRCYKAIHAGEILHWHRLHPDQVDLLNHESYRCRSRHLRDAVSLQLYGRVSRSNGTWQDWLFTTTPTPQTLAVLARANSDPPGLVEAYIYRRITAPGLRVHEMLQRLSGTPEPLSLQQWVADWQNDRVLGRLMGQVSEVLAWAILQTCLDAVGARVRVDVDRGRLQRFVAGDAAGRLLHAWLEAAGPESRPARVYRLGCSYAADGAVDLVTNFGLAAQVKYARLSVRAARRLAAKMPMPGSVICRRITGGSANGKDIVLLDGLLQSADRILLGQFGPQLGQVLRDRIRKAMWEELPCARPGAVQVFMAQRGYDRLPDWPLDRQQ